jgi:hypothetical protein
MMLVCLLRVFDASFIEVSFAEAAAGRPRLRVSGLVGVPSNR